MASVLQPKFTLILAVAPIRLEQQPANNSEMRHRFICATAGMTYFVFPQDEQGMCGYSKFSRFNSEFEDVKKNQNFLPPLAPVIGVQN